MPVAFATGAAIGFSAAGFLVRRAVQAKAARSEVSVTYRGRTSNPTLIINRWSGDGKAEQCDLAEKAAAAGIKVVHLERGDDLTQLAHQAVTQGADALGMAGGDGSLGLVAAVAIDREVPFFCVPVGTRNHFALDVGLDRDDPISALGALVDGEEIQIDYGLVGGRVFLNNVSFGVYAQAVHQDAYRAQKTDVLAKAVADVSRDKEKQSAIRFTTPDGVEHTRVPLLLVSNNPYTMSGPPDFGRRVRMDSGELGAAAVTNSDDAAGSAPRLGDGVSTQWTTRELRLESDDAILAAVDGEALEFDSPLELVIRPKALRLLVPVGTRPGYVSPGAAAAAEWVDLAKLGDSDK